MSRNAVAPIMLAALLVAGLLLWPRFADTEMRRQVLADQLSTALGRHVEVGEVHIDFLPVPSLALHEVHTALDDSPLEISRIDIALDWRAMLLGKIVVYRLDVAGVVLDQSLIEEIRNLVDVLRSSAPSDRSGARLREIYLKDVFWSASDGQLIGPFDASMKVSAAGNSSTLVVTHNVGILQAEVRSLPEGFDFEAIGSGWVVPFRGNVRLEHFLARGQYSEGRVEFAQAEIVVPEGKLHGSGVITRSRGWHAEGVVTATDLNLQKATSGFSDSVILGLVDGNCTFIARAPIPADIWRRPLLGCTLNYTRDGKTSRLAFSTAETKGGISYTLDGKDVLLSSGLFWETLRARGEITDSQALLQDLQAEGYQGTLTGHAVLTWSPQRNLSFEAVSQGVRIAPLLNTSKKRSLDGKLNSRCNGTLAATRPGHRLALKKLNCDFDILEGEIYDTDLETAARLLERGSGAAASTPFDRLTGSLVTEGFDWQFSSLVLTSRALEASGELRVDVDGGLTGDIGVGLRNTAGLMSVPLIVEGTVQAPVLRPAPSALAGGAAGTLLLGPGLGTAIGVKAGDALRKATRWLRPKEKTKSGNPIQAED